MRQVLIDTDVILDLCLDRKPFSDAAERIMSLAEGGQIKACITPVIVSNCYYLLRKMARHEKVVETLHDMLGFLEVLILDKDAIYKALHSDFKDFEDSLQNEAAVSVGSVDTIITRNVKDYKHSSLSVMTPSDFLASYKS
jgi:predicted nucleic acid-binding protein